MLTRKVCMIGDFAVGKTSLVARFVHQTFGAAYLTTVGVKIDTRELTLPSGDAVKLVLWDIAGKSAFARIDASYLRDAAGILLVCDSTRADTLDSALRLKTATAAEIGELPFCLLCNKTDLGDQRRIDAARLTALRNRDWPVIDTSALSGDGVDDAFQRLGAQLVHRL